VDVLDSSRPARHASAPSRRQSASETSHVPGYLWILAACCLAIVALAFAWYLVTQTRRQDAERQAVIAEAERQKQIGEEQLAQLKEVTALATLLDLNQKQIDEYHRIATDQADRSFKSSQRAVAMGLFVLVGCVAAGLYVPSSEARIFLGAIAAVGAAFSGFLNRTYIHMYGQTLAQLNRYFDQPVLTSYYLTAERLTQNLPRGPEGEVRKEIIRQVLANSSRLGGQPQEQPQPEPTQPEPKPQQSRKHAEAKQDIPPQASGQE
jgi:hypothetical protein